MKYNKNRWDQIFQNEGRVFENPHEDIPRLIPCFRARGVKRILDLGCGSGRHIVYLAKHNFEVYGIDASPVGIKLAKRWMEDEKLTASLIIGSIYNKLPYADAFFDAVISVQVIHHNTAGNIRRLIAEIWRVLQPEGLFFATVPIYKNQAERFRQIEENTFVPLDGREEGIPHYCFDEERIRKFLSAFKLLDIHVDSKSHYCFLGEKSPVSPLRYEQMRLEKRRRSRLNK